MIIPKRKASDYQRPEIVNEFDEIHKYIQEKRTLREIQVIMEGRMSDEAIEKLYIRVLKEVRRAKDRQRGFIIIGLIFLSIGLWLSIRLPNRRGNPKKGKKRKILINVNYKSNLLFSRDLNKKT